MYSQHVPFFNIMRLVRSSAKFVSDRFPHARMIYRLLCQQLFSLADPSPVMRPSICLCCPHFSVIFQSYYIWRPAYEARPSHASQVGDRRRRSSRLGLTLVWFPMTGSGRSCRYDPVVPQTLDPAGLDTSVAGLGHRSVHRSISFVQIAAPFSMRLASLCGT